MSQTVELQIVQYRPQMLYAKSQAGRYAPLCILSGFVFWEVAVFLACECVDWRWIAASGLASLMCFGAVPLMLMCGAWLSIDQMRGWVHYRLSGWHGPSQESFSPQRIDSLQVSRRGYGGKWLGWWEVSLRLDHPRLARVCLMRSTDRARVQAIVGALSASLEIDWYDEQSVRHRNMDRASRTSADHPCTDRNIQPPPPEIVTRLRQGTATMVLPSPGAFVQGMGIFLLYSFVWCLWAWTSLSLEMHIFGPAEQWLSHQYLILFVLIVASVIGALMLSRALFDMLSREELRATDKGWIMSRRWLGYTLGESRLSSVGIQGMRRIESPNRLTGLWFSDGPREVRLGSGLSMEALYWLQAMLRNDPQAEHAQRQAEAMGEALSVGPESDPDKSTPPTGPTGD